MDLWDRLAAGVQEYVENYYLYKSQSKIKPSYDVDYEIDCLDELQKHSDIDDYWVHQIAGSKDINYLPEYLRRLVHQYLPRFFQQYPNYKDDKSLTIIEKNSDEEKREWLKRMGELDDIAGEIGGYVVPSWEQDNFEESLTVFSAARHYCLAHNLNSSHMKDLDVVKLTKVFQGMPIGTVGVIVHEYDGKSFEVEFFDEEYNTIDVYTTPAEIISLVAKF